MVNSPYWQPEVTMPKSYEEIMERRLASVDPAVAAMRPAFEQAYDLAMALVDMRERHGLTQAQLAERCGVNQADISRIERGSTSPTTRTLQKIADALGADVRLVERVPT